MGGIENRRARHDLEFGCGSCFEEHGMQAHTSGFQKWELRSTLPGALYIVLVGRPAVALHFLTDLINRRTLTDYSHDFGRSHRIDVLEGNKTGLTYESSRENKNRAIELGKLRNKKGKTKKSKNTSSHTQEKEIEKEGKGREGKI